MKFGTRRFGQNNTKLKETIGLFLEPELRLADPRD